jgi:mitochondrial enoyl-[acyl-carrier protein] reductase / trans-2-enoyl-CoA reductase
MGRARYERRGPVPQDVIEAVEFETPQLQAAEALVEVIAAPINPSDVLILTGEYLPPPGPVADRGGVDDLSGKRVAVGTQRPLQRSELTCRSRCKRGSAVITTTESRMTTK